MSESNCPLISIIVPIYNTVSYIDKCINSILGQDYSNFELILIDDFSNDGSSKKIDEWEKKDKRIVVIHKEKNKGVSDSRNIGLSISNGKYIAFVDSDDYVEKTCYTDMIDLLEKTNADIAFGGFNKLFTNSVSKVKPCYSTGTILNSEQALKYCIAPMNERPSDVFIWDKIFRKKSLYINNDLYLMDSRFSYCEDMYWLVHILLKVEKVVCWNDCGYNYICQREGNTWSKINKYDNMEYCVSALKTNTAIWKLLKENNSKSTNNVFQRVLYYKAYAINTAIHLKKWDLYKRYSKGYIYGLVKWVMTNRTVSGIKWFFLCVSRYYRMCIGYRTFFH